MSIEVKKYETIATLQVNCFEDWARKLKVSLRKIQKDENIRAVILEFIGEKQFADKIKIKDLTEKNLLHTLKIFPIPIILIIKESAKGCLLEIVLASHLCIASDLARFEIEDIENLKKQIGVKNADKLKFFENEINAEKACDLGFINRVVLFNNVGKEAFKMAKNIAKLAPLAIRSCLKAVDQGLEINLEDGLKLETELFASIFTTEDMKEGTRAFLEKRTPKFRGK